MAPASRRAPLGSCVAHGSLVGVYDLDEVYERVHRYGPEFDGWLSNHAPMAADALGRIGGGEFIGRWLDLYSRRLSPPPSPHEPIQSETWRQALGDPRRLGDWTRWFERELADRPWAQVLASWWPRLLPGALAAATHPLIRAGHAVRALQEVDTEPRRSELAHALGYWAARWQPLKTPPPLGSLSAQAALNALAPLKDARGGIRERIAQLEQRAPWAADGIAPPASPADVPAALDALVDATVVQFATSPGVDHVMLVHATTAPRAARLCLSALPSALWPTTFEAAWRIAAALSVLYRSPMDDGTRTDTDFDPATIAERAADHGDEHVLKFTEVALESLRRGTVEALAAANRALATIDALSASTR